MLALLLSCALLPDALAKEKFNAEDKNWSKDKIKRYIRVKFADRGEKETKKAIAIFTAESGLRCEAKSKTNDIGVAQINKVHWSRYGGKDKLKSCKRNIDAAKDIYLRNGKSFRPWTAYTSGKYKRYL